MLRGFTSDMAFLNPPCSLCGMCCRKTVQLMPHGRPIYEGGGLFPPNVLTV